MNPKSFVDRAFFEEMPSLNCFIRGFIYLLTRFVIFPSLDASAHILDLLMEII